jgi:hypothetical protein
MAFVLSCASACGTGDTTVDPGELELRDLLGVAPEVATSWDAEQRAAARHVLVEALDDAVEPITIAPKPATSLDERVTRTLAVLDSERFAAGNEALALVRVELTASELIATTHAAPRLIAAANGEPAPALAIDTHEWAALSPRATEVLAAAALDAGHREGSLIVVPAPRLAVIASYTATTPPRLLVNPVLVAALDPAFVTTTTTAAQQTASTSVTPTKPTTLAAGNPYSFYGSVAECAYAQRLRCESCLASNNCAPVTTSTDGNAECTTLGANDGRGYFLLCINLSLAITSVEACAGDTVSSCTAGADTEAASDLGRLDANANFLDDATCAAGLDTCLAKIYGAPKNPFPAPVDGGMPPPPTDPPRDTNVDCGDSCSDNNSNCEASPSCNCDGPSCNNSFSCDSTCSSSNDQSGCGDNCDSCSSDDGTTSGGGGGGCGGDSGGSTSDSSCGGGDCGGGDCGGGDCGGSCGGDSGGTSGGGGDCGGGDCGGGGGDCGGDCGGGGGGGSCQVTRKKTPSAAFALAMSLIWGAMPIPFAAFARRRHRRRVRHSAATTDDSGETPTASVTQEEAP